MLASIGVKERGSRRELLVRISGNSSRKENLLLYGVIIQVEMAGNDFQPLASPFVDYLEIVCAGLGVFYYTENKIYLTSLNYELLLSCMKYLIADTF